MSEKSEIDTASSGGEDEGADPPIYLWWMLLAFLAAGRALALLGKHLFLAFELPRYARIIVTAPWLLLFFAAIHARPETIRQLGTAVAIGLAVAGLAMLYLLPVLLFSRGLDDFFLGITFDSLNVGLVLLLGLWIVLWAYRRLGVPRWQFPAKTGPDNDD